MRSWQRNDSGLHPDGRLLWPLPEVLPTEAPRICPTQADEVKPVWECLGSNVVEKSEKSEKGWKFCWKFWWRHLPPYGSIWIHLVGRPRSFEVSPFCLCQRLQSTRVKAISLYMAILPPGISGFARALLTKGFDFSEVRTKQHDAWKSFHPEPQWPFQQGTISGASWGW